MRTVAPNLQMGSLFGRTRSSILALLLLRPDERFHMRQVARVTGGGLGAVQRELVALTHLGIVRREESGRQVYFQADSNCPFFLELQGLVAKTTGVASVMKEALAAVSPRINVAVVYGSVASGKVRRESDVDLLVVSRELTVRDLAPAIRHASRALGREVNLSLYRPWEWAKRVSEHHPLAESILREPRIPVVGAAHELERLAKERLAEAAPAGSR